MIRDQSMVEVDNNKTGIRRLIWNMREFIRSRTQPTYFLREDSPEFLKRDKKLIVKTIKHDSKYLDFVPEDILEEELSRLNMPGDNIINIAIKRGYIIGRETPRVLLGEKARDLIIQYLNSQADYKEDMFNRGSGFNRTKFVIDQLDDNLISNDLFKQKIIKLAIQKGYNLDRHSPDYLKQNSILAERYFSNVVRNYMEFGDANSIMNPELLRNPEFLRNYISMFKNNGINNDVILQSLIYKDECFSTLKNDIGIFQYVFENLTPVNLTSFFNKFFSDDELEEFLSNNTFQGKLGRVASLFAKDKNILNSINAKMLDERYQWIPDYKMSLISLDPYFQEEIIGLDDFRLNLYKRTTEFVEQNTHRWYKFDGNIVENLSNGRYDELISDLYQQARNGNKISAQDIETLTHLFSTSSIFYSNTFNITSKEELEHYEEIRELVCDTVLNNPDLGDEQLTGPIEKYLRNFKDLSQLDRTKLALLEKYFNMDLSEASKLIETFSQDIDNVTSKDIHQQNIIEQIKAIKNIFETDNIDVLKQVADMDIFVEYDLSQSSFLMEQAEELFEDLFKQDLYMPHEKDRIGTTVYDGKEVEVFDAGTDLKMIVKTVANGSNRNFREIWNGLTSNIGFGGVTGLRFNTCTSYMTDENLLHKGENYHNTVILGFGDGTKDYSFKGMYNCDKHTSMYDSLKALSNDAGGKFQSPHTLEEDTDNSYNEIVINTISVDEQGNMTKMQPDYVVYIKEHSNLTLEDLESDDMWQNSKRFASEFGIPIVIIDREKIMESERKKIIEMTEGIQEEKSSTDAKKILKKVQHYEARYGRDSMTEYLPEKKRIELEEEIRQRETEQQRGILVPEIDEMEAREREEKKKQDILERQAKLRQTIAINGEDR